MTQRSYWKGFFVDAFLTLLNAGALFKMKNQSLNNLKIWSRRSSILPTFLDSSLLIYNGKTFIRCKITEGKVGHKLGEFAPTRKRRLTLRNSGQGRLKGKKS